MLTTFAVLLLGLATPATSAAVVGAPGGLAPASGASVTSVQVLTWTAVPDADRYNVEISADASFATSSLRYKGTVSTNRAPLPWDLAPGTTYSWRVQAVDSAGEAGAFSAVATFARQAPNAPVPTAPGPDAVLDHPETAPILTWNPMSGIKSYQVQWATNANFTTGPSETVGTATTVSASYALDTLLSPGRDYYWRVRGIYPAARSTSSTEDKATEYSAARAFRLEWGENSDPTLLTPADTPDPAQAMKTPEFRWTAVRGAARYRLQISAAPTFDSVTLDKTLLRTSYVPTSSLTSGAYYWRVAALDAEGSQGPWSIRREFYRSWLDDGGLSARPTLSVTDVDPASDGIQVYRDEVLLQWEPVPGASHYEVEFASPDNAAFLNKTSTKFRLCKTAQTSLTPVFAGKYVGSEHLADCNILRSSSGLDLSTQPYVWIHMAAIDVKAGGGELRSLWSDQARPGEAAPGAVQLFLVDPPDDGTDATEPAQQHAPADASDHTESPHLMWHRVSGATKYLVALSKSQDFDGTVLDPAIGYVVTAGTRLTIPEPLANSVAGESYYWYVLPCVGWQTTSSNQCEVSPNKAINQTGKYRAFRKNTPEVTGLGSEQLTASGTQSMQLSWYRQPADRNAGYQNSTKYYQVEISTDPDFSDVAKRVLNPTATEGRTDALVFVPEVKLNPGETYYWHVRAVDGGGQPLTWSETKFFTFDDSATPTGLATAGAGPMKSLRWNAVPSASSYTVEVYSGADPAFPLANRVASDSSEFPAWTPSTFLPPGTYSWRVRRTDALGMAGQWSAGTPTFSVASGAPGLSSPAASAKVAMKNLVFSWTAVPGAAAYQLQVSRTADFATVFDSVSSTNLQWVPTKPGGYPAGVYYWRVQAMSSPSSGKVLATSPTRGVTVTAPPGQVTGVSGTKVGKGSIALAWTTLPVNDGGLPLTAYRVWSRAGSGSWVEQPPVGPSAAARTVTGLANSTSYEFRVAGRNDAGTGKVSRSVIVTTPGVPGAPRSLSVTGVVGGISARWSAPTSDLPVTAYRVAYRRAGTAPWTTALIGQTSWTKTGLVPNARYEFKVAALNAVGVGADAVFTGGVLTKAAPSVPRSVRVTPATTTAKVVWLAPATPGSSAVSGYLVSYRVAGATAWTSRTTSATSLTLSGLRRKTSYQVTVAAKNSAATGPASAAVAFRTK